MFILMILASIACWFIIKEIYRSKSEKNLTKIFSNEIYGDDDQIHQKIKQSLSEYKSKLEKKYAQDISLKNQLSEFAKKNKLDTALIEVWNEIKYYPAFVERHDFHKVNLLQIEDIKDKNEGDKHKKENIIISFIWKEINFRIQNEIKKSLMPESGGVSVFNLFENNELVFKVSAKIRTDKLGDYMGLAYPSVEVLKKREAWVNFLMDSWEKIQFKKIKRSIESQFAGLDQIKNNFQD